MQGGYFVEESGGHKTFLSKESRI